MRPLTHTNAKQLLPIANVPILHRAVMKLVQEGVSDIAVIVGSTAQMVRESLGDGSDFGASFTFIQQDKPLGLAHCVTIARPFLEDEPFVMYLGDNMFEHGISGILHDFGSSSGGGSQAAQVAVKVVSNPSAFGIATVDSKGMLVAVEEKPSHPKSNLALVGTYVFTPAIHEAIEKIYPSARGELEITDAIQVLIDSGLMVGVSEVDGWWYDTGNPRSFLECNAAVIEMESNVSSVNIRPGVTIIEPCVIDMTATLDNCTVGPNVSIGRAVSVSGCTLRDSAVFDYSLITGDGILSDSIVGKSSTLNLSGQTSSNLVIGDDSIVEVSLK
jgi:glucose-1-phosphate thymidylyltransferase